MKLLSQEELRDYFKTISGKRLSTPLIKKMIAKGLPIITIGRRKKFCLEDVEAWLRNPTKRR